MTCRSPVRGCLVSEEGDVVPRFVMFGAGVTVSPEDLVAPQRVHRHRCGAAEVEAPQPPRLGMPGGRVQAMGAQVHEVHRRIVPTVGVHISPVHPKPRSLLHEDRIGRRAQAVAGASQAEHARAVQPHALDDLHAAVLGAQLDAIGQILDRILGRKVDVAGEVLAGVAVAVEEAHVQIEGFVHGDDARTEQAQPARL